MRLIFLVCIASVLFSCNNSSTVGEHKDTIDVNKGADTISDQKPAQLEDITGCYLRILKRDTMVLRLEQNGQDVSGKMSFDNFEKDGSSGSVSGKVNGNVIELLYSFQSEGMNSVRELFFKMQDGKLISGIGPIGMRGDTAYFSNRSAIEYPQQEAFDKVNCDGLHAKYK